MGIIRFLLALSVVSAHTNPHKLLGFVGGVIAVQAFFFISGFYMAMVVGSYKTKKQFWINRYLRLYPTYIVCALLVLFTGGIGHYIHNIKQIPISAICFLVFTNLTIFFQDITMFLGFHYDTLSFVKSFTDSTISLHSFLLIPQGWSLGLELSFYILAPFILNRSIRTIIIICFLSAILRIVLNAFDFTIDPWSYRFFPSELSNFLLGSLAYKLYEMRKIGSHDYEISIISFLTIVFFLIGFNFLPADNLTKQLVFMGILAFSIGDIFNLTKNSKVDNFIGMLSYPIYISHIFVINHLLGKLHLSSPNGDLSTTIIAYAVIILFSVALYLLIEKPVDSFRRRFKSNPSKV